MKQLLLCILAGLILALTACTSGGVDQLVVMTHDSFSISQPVVDAFEKRSGIEIVFLKSGDAGQALNKAILSREAPLADLFFGVDNTFLSRALEADIFEPHGLPVDDSIPEEFLLDPQGRLIPVDYGDICINYDRAFFAASGLFVPDSLESLIQPEYSGLLVVENPATSSPGLGFMLATITHFGEDGWLDFWRNLRRNGVEIVDGWQTAYYTNFSGSSGRGAQPMVVSYASSPAAEVYFADPPVTDAPTASIYGKDACFRQVEFAGILSGTRQNGIARDFLTFMLEVQFQEDIPLQMFMYPVNLEAALPDVFTRYAQTAPQPARMDPARIAEMREEWIDAWTDVMLH